MRLQFNYIVLFILLICGVFAPTGSYAQDSECSFRDFEYNRNSNAWFSSRNAAGLQNLPEIRLSKGEISFDKGKGDFINFSESDNRFTIGGNVESFYRLNSRVVLYGKINYSHFKGENMGGSIFIDPSYNPFDIVERADTNRGDKQLETYRLIGAMSADIYKGILLGLKVDYETANYAKHKDLRHTNKWLDLSFSAGLSYRLNQWIELGGNYNYRRTVEDVALKIFGNTDRNYYSLVSYGSFFGKNELFTSSTSSTGYTSIQDGYPHPLLNQFHGGSAQLNLDFTPTISLFNEFTFSKRSGHFGEKAEDTLYYSEHDGDSKEYNATFSFKQKKNHHLLKLSMGKESLQNYEMITQKETDSDGGGSSYVYYGRSQKLDRRIKTLNAEWTSYLGVQDLLPMWELNAGVRFYDREQVSSVYPYYRTQGIHSHKIHVNGIRNVVKDKNMYTLHVGILFGNGGGNRFYDGVYSDSTESKNEPATLNDVLYKEFEYLATSHIQATIGAAYSRLFKNNIQGFVRLQYERTQASEVTYLNGKSFDRILLKVGCLF